MQESCISPRSKNKNRIANFLYNLLERVNKYLLTASTNQYDHCPTELKKRRIRSANWGYFLGFYLYSGSAKIDTL